MDSFRFHKTRRLSWLIIFVVHAKYIDRYMGDTTDSSQGTKDVLYVASRCQVNFIENVPIALVLALLAELNGADRYGLPRCPLHPYCERMHSDMTNCRKYINLGLGALFALRVSHAEFGMMLKDSAGWGRPLGYYGTQGVLAALTGYLSYLVKDYWQIL